MSPVTYFVFITASHNSFQAFGRGAPSDRPSPAAKEEMQDLRKRQGHGHVDDQHKEVLSQERSSIFP